MNTRKFEKISFEQFKKDVSDDLQLYESYNIPCRCTKNSAGYDFESLTDLVIKPKEIIKIPTGIKVSMYKDELLMIIVRSSTGAKYNVRLCNQVGIIDSDYYNIPSNEGHIWVPLQNEGSKDFIIKKGDKLVQGIFQKFLVTEDEEEIKGTRIGGFGSTNKEERI